jgi:hypothetical protein
MDIGRQKSKGSKLEVLADITFSSTRNKETNTHRSTSRKENRDRDIGMANTLVDAPKDARKRKLQATNGVASDSERLKKLKSSGDPLADKMVNRVGDTAESQLLGPTFYCHQCSKKREGAGEFCLDTWFSSAHITP